ncbi:MAG TPA: response regulator [Verrucomicrobiae bacterium]|jgi:PAS domain S-box-containing protein
MNTTLRVLLVDDEEASFFFLKRLLSRVPQKSFTTDWASTYDAGMTALNENRHDVCLLDHRLGPRTGLDLLREAGAQNIQIPIIILTSSDDPKVDLQAAELGAADFVPKDRMEPVMLERVIRYSVQHAATLKALQKSHERFRLLFERSMDAILISNDQGQFVEVNSAACRLLGMSREKLLARNWHDVFAQNLRPPTERRSEALTELSFTKSSGERLFIEFSSTQLAPDLSLSILRDVTERRNLEREIQEISEREQRRLGQDLHDGLGQSMTGIAFLAKVLQQKLKAKSVEEAESAGNIASLINEALAQTRRLSRGLCPVVLDTNDIEAALEQLAENLRTLFSISCESHCDRDVKISDNTVAVHLYRIAQEAATNAIKHGHAKNVLLSLAGNGSRVILTIKDDGKGFPPKTKSKGMGLRVMHHRARMIGATISVRQPREGGITVTCSLARAHAAKKKHNSAQVPVQKDGVVTDSRPAAVAQ